MIDFDLDVCKRGSLRERFFKYVRKTKSCWEWTGTKHLGYGKIRYLHGAMKLAHRVSYAMLNGEIKKGLHVLHRCDNPGCVNPKHLFLGTHLDNMRDMARKGRRFDNSGENSPKAKFTYAQVKRIRKELSKKTAADISRKFGVSESTISNIKNNITWKMEKQNAK